MSTLAVKFGTLALRTIAKPIAGIIKEQVKHHPKFRRTILLVAQKRHAAEIGLRVRILRQEHDLDTTGKPKIRPLNEAKAIETGANFVAETFIFAVGGAAILFEALRRSGNEKDRREDVQKQISDANEELHQSDIRHQLAIREMRSYFDSRIEELQDEIEFLERQNRRPVGWISGVFRSIPEEEQRKRLKKDDVWKILGKDDIEKGENRTVENDEGSSNSVLLLQPHAAKTSKV